MKAPQMNKPPLVTLRKGGLYLSRALYELYFKGLEGIVLLRDAGDLLVMPVQLSAAGGYFLKIRNGAGDRVVSAPDFFRQQGLAEEQDRQLAVRWDFARAALVVLGAFDTVN